MVGSGGGCVGSILGSGAGSEGFTNDTQQGLVARKAMNSAGITQIGINTED